MRVLPLLQIWPPIALHALPPRHDDVTGAYLMICIASHIGFTFDEGFLLPKRRLLLPSIVLQHFKILPKKKRQMILREVFPYMGVDLR